MGENEMGRKIKALRNKRNLTLEQVGDYVGVGKSTVRKWETGDIANMRRDKIAKLAKVLGVSPSYLMGWEENASSHKEKLTEKDEKDIKKEMEKIKLKLKNDSNLLFDGEILDEVTKKLLLDVLEQQERLVKEINKKYTPKKYRKDK